MKLYFALFVSLCSFIACQGPEGQLIGTWDDQEAQMFQFDENGEGQWILYKSEPGDTFEITYETDWSTEPNKLDVTLHGGGGIEGQMLYCSFAMTEEGNLRLDCERKKANRPPDLSSAQTKTYVSVK